jgi:hypothetical protein
MVLSLSPNVRDRRKGCDNQIIQERQLATQLRWSSGPSGRRLWGRKSHSGREGQVAEKRR